MDISLEIHCATCGSANYGLPQGLGDGASILCNDCGATMGTLAALQAELLDMVMARSAEALRRGLGSLADGKAA